MRTPQKPEVLFSFLVLALITLLAFLLRCHRLGIPGLFYDESFDLETAGLSLPMLVSRTTPIVHPPLYYMLLHWWLPFSGPSEFAVRFLSVLPAVLLVPLLAQLGKRLFGTKVGLAIALLAAVAPFFVSYAQEARMYSQVAFFSLAGVSATVWAFESNHWRYWFSATLSFSLAVYSHYYGLLPVFFVDLLFAVVLGVRLWRSRQSPLPTWMVLRPVCTRWLVAQALLVLLLLPAIYSILHAVNTYTGPAHGQLDLLAVFRRAFSVFTSGQAAEAPLLDRNLAWGCTLALLPLLVLGALPFHSSRRNLPAGASSSAPLLTTNSAPHLLSRFAHPSQVAGPLLFASGYLLIPFLSIFFLSLGRRDFAPRYLIVAAPAYFILLGRGLVVARHFRWGLVIVLTGCLLVASIFSAALYNRYYNPAFGSDDFRSPAFYIRDHAERGDVVIFDAPFVATPFEHYYSGLPGVGLPGKIDEDRVHTEAQLRDLQRRYSRVWLVVWQDTAVDPGRLVQNWLQQHAFQIGGVPFHNVTVYEYLTRFPVLDTAPPTLSTQGHPASITLGGQVRYLGYRQQVESLSSSSPPRLHFTLYWQALHPLSTNYHVFIQLRNGSQQVWGSADQEPLQGYLPTTSWPVNKIVADEYELYVLAGTPPGSYTVQVGMYNPSGFVPLLVTAGAPVAASFTAGAISLDRVALHMPLSPLGLHSFETVLVSPGGEQIALLGYTLGGEQRAGGVLQLTLFWRARTAITHDYTVFTHLGQQNHPPLTGKDNPPADGNYPTSGWQTGDLVRDQYSLVLPAQIPNGHYQLEVGMYQAKTGQRLKLKDNANANAVLLTAVDISSVTT